MSHVVAGAVAGGAVFARVERETAVADFAGVVVAAVAAVAEMRRKRIPQPCVLPLVFPHIVQNSSYDLREQGLR